MRGNSASFEVAEEIVAARSEVEEIVGREITKEMMEIIRKTVLDCSVDEARKKKKKKKKNKVRNDTKIRITK